MLFSRVILERQLEQKIKRGRVLELAYNTDLESVVYGFESHPAHQSKSEVVARLTIIKARLPMR